MDTCQHCGQPVESQGFRPKKFCSDSCRYDFHNKKKKKWTLKKLAKHYQETGEYLPEAEALEEIHLMSIAERIETKYNNLKLEFTSDLLELDDLIDIEIGHWQANHGFVRPYDSEELMEKFNKKLENK